MSTDRDALLAAICANPDEDSPRLVFADWCDENDDPERAEFIRLQIESERYEEWTPERMDIEERATEILERHRDDWLKNLPAWAHDQRWPPGLQVFRRGFMHRASVTAEHFLAASNDLFAVAPIREIRIGMIRDGGRSLADAPEIGRLSTIEFSFAEISVNLPTFLSSPYLAGLIGLGLKFVGPAFPRAPFWDTLPILDDEGAVALAACASLAGLKSLDVAVGMISDRGIAALAESPHLKALEKLDIRANPIEDEGIIQLAHSPLATRLIELNLYATRMSDLGLQALLDVRPLRLQRLHLGAHQNCPITDVGVEAFARCDALTSLQELDLSGWQLNRSRVRAISRSPHLAGLRILQVSSTGFDDDMAEELAASPHLRNLRFLDLQNNQIGAKGIRALARSPVLNSVTNLVLHNNPAISDAGIIALANSEHVGNIRHLCLVTTGFGIDGLRAVADSQRLNQLRDLDVQSTPFGDEGSRSLCESPYLNRLTRLAVYDCGIAEDCEIALRKRFGAALKIRAV